MCSEGSLKEMSSVVEEVERRAADVGQEAGSLLTFGLGWLPSLLVVAR